MDEPTATKATESTKSEEPTEKSLFQNQPNISLPEENRKPVILFVVALLIIIIVGVVLFISSQRNKTKSTKIPNPTETAQITLVPTQKMGISTEWTTLTSIYNYSLKYPANWQIYKTSWQEEGKLYDLQQDDEAVIRFREPEQPAHSGDAYGLTISLKKPAANPDNLTIRDWMKENYPAFSFIKTEDITVAGIKSVKVTTLVGRKYIYVLIPFNGKVYQLVNHPFTTKDAPKTAYQNLYDYENIFNQILTTVQFLRLCDSCPSIIPPNPDWCIDGKITAGENIYHEAENCYCTVPPVCKR